MPCTPHLISSAWVNQEGFYIEFGEDGLFRRLIQSAEMG